MNQALGTCPLPDGRQLGYSAHGDPDGNPVFILHGLPGARFQHHPDTAIAAALGIRVIVPERPGYGMSDPQPGRMLSDGCDDLATLADHLGIERFAVVGYSFGGLYALACARRLRARITRVALVSSLAPLDAPGIMDGVTSSFQQLCALARTSPQTLPEVLQGIATNPDALFQMYLQIAAAPDQRLMNTPPIAAALLRDFAAVLRQRVAGMASDIMAAIQPWMFPLEDIETTIQLWHGEADINVMPSIGCYLTATLPRCHARFCADEGHLLLFSRWTDILRALVVP